MSVDGLKKQVEEPVDRSPELRALKRRIDALLVLYVVLFATSLVLIVAKSQRALGADASYLWAIALGSAVATRLYRQSQVRKYNALLTGRPAPLS